MLNNFYISWKNFFKLKKICKKNNNIIFYAENSSDWAYLRLILEKLMLFHKNIINITSENTDEILLTNNSYYVGSEIALNLLFRNIKAKAIIMTLTDLDSFYIKKSIYPVHYFYVFHSLVSTHRVYREKAFFAYDTILCTGQYQINEIRKIENLYNLPKKNLEKCGYGRLDFLIAKYKNKKKINNLKNNVLISPTWGKSSIFGKTLIKLIEILIKSNYFVTLRLHPMTKRHYPKKIEKLTNKYILTNKFNYDEQLENSESLINADVLISDWSGSSMEYAFATKKPVISIDTNPKINNKNWEKIGLPCLEEEIRDKIGIIISENDLIDIPIIIKKLIFNKKVWEDKIEKLSNKKVFNISKSAEIAVQIISKKIKC